MGASLDTQAQCPLCKELISSPVVLKCNHSFCERCLGDLWSVYPNGPYHCPKWKCKTVYQTLPFDRPSSLSQHAEPSRNAGATSKRKLGGVLGKRKASESVPEQQPLAKRSVADSALQEPSNERETAPISHQKTAAGLLLVKEDTSKAAQSVSNTGLTSRESFSSTDEAEPGKPNNEPASTSRDTDSTSELDICDPPLTSKVAQQTGAPSSQATGAPSSQATGTPSSQATGTPSSQATGTPSSQATGTPSSQATGAPSSQTKTNPLPLVLNAGKDTIPLSPISRWALPGLTKSPGAAPSSHSSSFPSSFFKRVSFPPSGTTNHVPCHYCPSTGQQSAVKTCLVCGASMCKEHLRPHLESPVFRSHTLVAPLEDISPWRCQEHQEMNRIFCRQCAVCVCTVCTVIGCHRDHDCVSIREAEADLRRNLKGEIQQLQENEKAVMSRVSELTQKKQEFKVVLDEARSGVQQQYIAMRQALEQEEQSALQCVTQEESRAVGSLEGQLSQLQDSLVSIQKGLYTLEGLADAKGDRLVQEQAFIMEYNKIHQMLSDMETSVGRLEPPEELDRGRLSCLQKWTEKRLDTVVISLPDRDPYRLLYGTIPSLDPDTAHPKLLLSKDNRNVSYSEAQLAYTEHEARFSSFPQVLASRALKGGRWYWEVEVPSEDGRWKVGLSEAQITRKGQRDSCRLGFNPHSWCLACDRGKLEALHDKVAISVATDRLERVGIFLDFNEGTLSFYNVTPGGSLNLLHCYKQAFVEPLYPAFSVSKTQLTICDLFEMSST